MNSSDYQYQKSQLEYTIGQSQSVINSVNESTEMPAERKQVYLDYERPRLAEFNRQLADLTRSYYGSYYGYTCTGATVGI